MRCVKPLHGDRTGRFGQESQFVQVFSRFALVLVFRDQSHQDGGFGFDFGLYEFFHKKMMLKIKGMKVSQVAKLIGY